MTAKRVPLTIAFSGHLRMWREYVDAAARSGSALKRVLDIECSCRSTTWTLSLHPTHPLLLMCCVRCGHQTGIDFGDTPNTTTLPQRPGHDEDQAK